MHKAAYILICFLISFSALYGQSRGELLKMADASFDAGNYNSAAYYYGKIIGSFESGEDERIYPYDYVAWVKPLKEDKKNDSTSNM